MKKLFFILTFALFYSFDASATNCSDISVNPTINFSYSFGNLSYDNTKSVQEISEIAKSFNLVENNAFARGLATANVKFDISIKTATHPIGIKQFCVVPANVEVFLGLEDPTIYMANTLQEGSCEYNIVLRHEKTHQQINKTAIEYYLPIFKASVTNIVKKISAIPIGNTNQIEQTTRNLTEEYSSKIMPLVNFIKKEISQEQIKLDNQVNYALEGQLCQNN